MEKICYIVGACSNNLIKINKKENDMVIAADGGYDFIENKNIIDLLLGDFDSIDKLPDFKNVQKFPVEKDDTDLFLAYKSAKEKNYKNFIFYGGIGGRTDHTMANIQMLSYMAEKGDKAFLIGENTIITAISGSEITIKGETGKTLSVFSASDKCENVTISGLKYNCENIILKNTFPLGVSNEFTDHFAKISVHNGTLIIIWYVSDDKNIDISELFNCF